MKHLKMLILPSLALLILSFNACKPCCTDPEIVKIPANDATPPVLRWEVSVLTQTDDGPISSMTMYTDPVTNISVKKTDEVNVYLVARDEESGVKKMNMEGNFAFTCMPAGGGQGLSLHGFTPKRSVDFNKLTTCGLKEWKLSIEALQLSYCPNNLVINGGGINITGTGENFKGGTSSLSLNINVTE
jgi:hypothetical protein